MLRQVINHIPMDVRRPLKHALAGVSVAMAVLIPGAFWYKASMMSMAQSSTSENVSMLKSRLMTLRQQTLTEAIIASPGAWDDKGKASRPALRRDLPFDLVVSFDGNRRLVDGFRVLSSNKQAVSLGVEAVKRLVPADSAFFDQLPVSTSASGILKVDDRAMIIAVTMSGVAGSAGKPGYLVFGRWLDPRRLASFGGQGESRIELYDLNNESRMSEDVRASISPAQRGDGHHWMMDKNSGGNIYALIDDIGGRPAFVAKVPWSLSWRKSGQLGFRLFFVSAVMAGMATWIVLYLGYRRDRKRVRRFDGLESLKGEHIRTLVEAFPGYAFAVTGDFRYVGVSRILAGVTGQEPSYFFDQKFGTVATEWDDGSLERTFRELSNPNRWPRVANINHVVEGLGERHVFHGTAHYLAKQGLMLVILTQKENSGAISSPESSRFYDSSQLKAG